MIAAVFYVRNVSTAFAMFSCATSRRMAITSGMERREADARTSQDVAADDAEDEEE